MKTHMIIALMLLANSAAFAESRMDKPRFGMPKTQDNLWDRIVGSGKAKEEVRRGPASVEIDGPVRVTTSPEKTTEPSMMYDSNATKANTKR